MERTVEYETASREGSNSRVNDFCMQSRALRRAASLRLLVDWKAMKLVFNSFVPCRDEERKREGERNNVIDDEICKLRSPLTRAVPIAMDVDFVIRFWRGRTSMDTQISGYFRDLIAVFSNGIYV